MFYKCSNIPSDKNFAVKMPKYGINLKFHSSMSSLTLPQMITIYIRLALLIVKRDDECME